VLNVEGPIPCCCTTALVSSAGVRSVPRGSPEAAPVPASVPAPVLSLPPSPPPHASPPPLAPHAPFSRPNQTPNTHKGRQAPLFFHRLPCPAPPSPPHVRLSFFIAIRFRITDSERIHKETGGAQLCSGGRHFVRHDQQAMSLAKVFPVVLHGNPAHDACDFHDFQLDRIPVGGYRLPQSLKFVGRQHAALTRWRFLWPPNHQPRPPASPGLYDQRS